MRRRERMPISLSHHSMLGGFGCPCRQDDTQKNRFHAITVPTSGMLCQNREASIIAAVATVIFRMVSNWDHLFGWSAGFLALCINFLITALLSVGNARTP